MMGGLFLTRDALITAPGTAWARARWHLHNLYQLPRQRSLRRTGRTPEATELQLSSEMRLGCGN
jgi:hypothetical protein